MAKYTIKKSSVSESLHHVGMIVRDVDKTAEFYESLGIGPFEPLVTEAVERKLKGKSFQLKLKIRMAHVGPARIELIQPVAGEGPWQEFLDRHGEGCSHIAFVVDDIEKAKAELRKKGLNVFFESWFKKGGGAAYLESDRLAGIVLEVLQRPGDYVPRERRG